MKPILKEEGVVVGNVYGKYHAKNPVARFLMNRFLVNLDQMVEISGSSQIHEVGCGEGYLSARYSDGVKKILATDFSTHVVSQAKALHAGSGIEFGVRSIYDKANEKDCADLVLCCEVLEHLEDPEVALKVLADMAQSWCIVTVPNEPIWRILNLCRLKYVLSLGNTPGHIQHWSRRKIAALVGAYFEIVEIRSPLPWTMLMCRSRRC